MPHINAPSAVIHIVTRHETIGGHVIKRHDITGEKLPYRISRRMHTCHTIGLSVVKALTANSDVIAVEVSDGTRTMAQWRLMENGLGYTGTHQSHPLTPKKITFDGTRWR